MLSKSTVCRTCKNLVEGVCSFNQVTAPNNVNECWTYSHKGDNLNLSNRSGETYSHRLPGTWLS